MTGGVYVLTTDPPPLPGLPASGAGLRAWGLAEGLRSIGISKVKLVFAADALRGKEIGGLPADVEAVERRDLPTFIRDLRPDALVLQHWGMADRLPAKLSCPLAIDLAGPHLLERRFWGSRHPARDLRDKLSALSRADFLVCSGTRQRLWFLPFLHMAGWDLADDKESLLPVIPFSVPPTPPTPSEEDRRDTILFSGHFLPWQDPALALRATLAVLDGLERGRLLLVGGPPPSGDVSGGSFQSLLETLLAHPRVEVRSPMAFDDLASLMASCGAGLDVMARNAERELAWPSRTAMMLWCGLPPIHHDYDEPGELIARHGAGWAVPHDNAPLIQGAVESALSGNQARNARADSARRLAREQLAWDRTIGPLAEWCSNPVKRVGKRKPLIQGVDREPSQSEPIRRAWTRSHPATVRGANWPVRALALLVAVPAGLVLAPLFVAGEIRKRFLAWMGKR